MTELRHGKDFDEATKTMVKNAIIDMLERFRKENPHICPGCSMGFFLYYVALLMASTESWQFDDVLPILAGAFDVSLVAQEMGDLDDETQEGIMEALRESGLLDDDDSGPTVH